MDQFKAVLLKEKNASPCKLLRGLILLMLRSWVEQGAHQQGSRGLIRLDGSGGPSAGGAGGPSDLMEMFMHYVQLTRRNLEK